MATTTMTSDAYLKNVFIRFYDNLNILFNRSNYISEEDVRSSLYLAFYNNIEINIKMENIYLEYRH